MRGDETIVATPSGGRDDYGDPLPTGQPQRIDGCAVIPRRVNDPERGIVLIEGFEIFAPPVAAARALTAKDAVTVRGGKYEVEGQPGHYRKRGEWRAVQIFVKKVGT